MNYGIIIEGELLSVQNRFKEMLSVVRCDFEEKNGVIFVPEKKGEAMRNLLINIRNNRT